MRVVQQNKGHRNQQFYDRSTKSLIVKLASKDKVEMKTMSYVVTTNHLFSDIGGGLGLFLGFSLLSTLSALYDRIIGRQICTSKRL